MDWFWSSMTVTDVYSWEMFLDNWFFIFAFAFLAIELIRYGFRKTLSWPLIGDSVVNYITLFMFVGITFLLLATLYLAIYGWVAQFSVFNIGINWAVIFVCIILADLAYYWEHRFMHRVNLAWATHSVHHSSPFFNISVAYRFGPMDGVWPIFFHLPLVLLGFNPFVVFFAEKFVQLYQTALHTEIIKTLPKPIEGFFNTPSHHRVHHGSNTQYLDRNYAGMFIVWDRIFGTFSKEDEPVIYGLVKPIAQISSFSDFLKAPFIAFFHGVWRLGQNFFIAKGFKNKASYIFGPPELMPGQEDTSSPFKPALLAALGGSVIIFLGGAYLASQISDPLSLEQKKSPYNDFVPTFLFGSNEPVMNQSYVIQICSEHNLHFYEIRTSKEIGI